MQAEISDGLKRVIQSEYEGLMIALLDTFGDMGIYVPSSRLFWQDQLLFFGKYITNTGRRLEI